MTSQLLRGIRLRRAGALLIASFLLASLLPGAVSAAVSITPATGGTAISADTAGGSYTVLTGPSINGTASGDLGAGTLTLTAPAGFQLHAAAGGAVLSGAACGTLNIGSQSVGTTTVTVSTTGSSTGACSIVFSGLEIRPTAGAPLATGNITASGLASGPAGQLVEVPGAPDHLAFTSYPANPSSAALGTIAVAVKDKFENTVTTDVRTIQLAVNKNSGTFSCSGGTSQTTSPTGVATFGGCTQTTVATGYLVSADDGAGGLAAKDGASFDITSGAASTLEICWGPGLPCGTTPPTTIKGGEAFPTQPTVRVKDAGGNTVTADSMTVVTLAISTNPGGGALSCPGTGSLSLKVTSGVATFSGCKIDKAGSGYRITATSVPSYAQATTNAFDVAVGSADHLLFTSYPATPATTSLGTITVAVKDKGDNTVTTDTRTITLTINKNSGTFTCSPGTSRSAVAGVATFTCSQTTVATGYLVSADDGAGGLAAITGASFDVTSGAASKLAVCWGPGLPCSTTVPTTITGGVAFPTQPTVRVLDAGGNTVTADSTTVVTLAISTNPGSGTLTCPGTGSLSLKVTSGVATFSGCRIDKAGTGYRLTATSSPSFTSATTNAFNVAVGPATKLAFTAQPSSSAVAVAFTTQPVVTIQDTGGNTVTTGTGSTATVTLAIGTNPGGGTLTCTGGLSKVAVAGVATFAGCKIDKGGTGYTLIATSTGLTSATSNAFNLTAPAAVMTLLRSSGMVTYGQFATLSVQFQANGASRPIYLEYTYAGIPWTTVASTTTNSTGLASATYKPARSGYYRIRFDGAADLSAAYSNVVLIGVRQVIQLRPTHSGTMTIAKGREITFRGTVRPAPVPGGSARVTFRFYQKKSGSWVLKNERHVATDTTGVARTTFTFGVSGNWYVMAFADTTRVNAVSRYSQKEYFYVK